MTARPVPSPVLQVETTLCCRADITFFLECEGVRGFPELRNEAVKEARKKGQDHQAKADAIKNYRAGAGRRDEQGLSGHR